MIGLTSASIESAEIYECEIAHTRTTPVRNKFRYRTYLWLVDIDELPRLPRALRLVADFRAADHLGIPNNDGRAHSIRHNLDIYLAVQGIDLCGGKVLLLTAARVFGYVFNPLSVYWCHHADGSLACVVAEVHNTYGGRHCYLVRTDETGSADVEKDFYVSPFEPASGALYRMNLPEPSDRLSITITLCRPGAAPFVADLRGRRRPLSTVTLTRLLLRYPIAPLVVSARIRWQGIRLLVRGLRVVHRPDHKKQEAVQ